MASMRYNLTHYIVKTVCVDLTRVGKCSSYAIKSTKKRQIRTFVLHFYDRRHKVSMRMLLILHEKMRSRLLNFIAKTETELITSAPIK